MRGKKRTPSGGGICSTFSAGEELTSRTGADVPHRGADVLHREELSSVQARLTGSGVSVVCMLGSAVLSAAEAGVDGAKVRKQSQP